MVGARASVARRSARSSLVGAALLALLSFGPTVQPAFGHASGELPTAELRAEGTTVHVELVAPADDAAVIGTALGILGDGAMHALLGGAPDDLPTPEQISELSRSPALRAYLEEHVTIRQDGVACPGVAHPADDFLTDGARLEFECPAPVERADVRITVLHDQDPAYRTFSIDGTAQYAIHSASAPEHTWDFTLARANDRDPTLVAGAAVAVVVLAGLVLAAGPRRRRSRR